MFSSSLRQLENKHSGRLEKTEEQRMRVRKVHAPRLARLALDSTSLRDMVLYGVFWFKFCFLKTHKFSDFKNVYFFPCSCHFILEK